MPKLFFVPSDLSLGVYNSQVLPLVSKSDYTIHSRSKYGKIVNIRQVYRLLLSRSINKVYIREPKSFILFLFLKILSFNFLPVFYDFRGLVALESRYKGQENYKFYILNIIENLPFYLSNDFSTVSNNFRQYLLKKYGSKKYIHIFPSCAPRAILNKNNLNLSFVYIGGLSKWQNVENIAKCFNELLQLLPEASLTVITPKADEAIKFFSEIPINNIVFKSLGDTDVINELSNYSFGFIFRDDNLINKVSSPIKVSEYISAGVVPIFKGCIGDFNDITTFNDNSICYVDALVTSNEVRQFIIENTARENLYDLAINYTWESKRASHPFLQ